MRRFGVKGSSDGFRDPVACRFGLRDERRRVLGAFRGERSASRRQRSQPEGDGRGRGRRGRARGRRRCRSRRRGGPAKSPTGSFSAPSTSSAGVARDDRREGAAPSRRPRADFVLVLKGPRRMLLLRGDRVLRDYEVALGPNPSGAEAAQRGRSHARGPLPARLAEPAAAASTARSTSRTRTRATSRSRGAPASPRAAAS